MNSAFHGQLFSWTLQCNAFKLICKTYQTGRLSRPKYDPETKKETELTSLYKNLIDQISPMWDFIGDVNDPSKPMFKDQSGEVFYMCLYQACVKFPDGSLMSTLLAKKTLSSEGKDYGTLSGKCFYSFSKDTTSKRYIYDVEESTLTEISKSHIPGSIFYFSDFKTLPIFNVEQFRPHGQIIVDALASDIVVKKINDDSIDYILKSADGKSEYLDINTRRLWGIRDVDTKGVGNDPDHNLISFALLSNFISGKEYQYEPKMEVITPWGSLRHEVKDEFVTFHFDCHNVVKVKCRVMDTFLVVKNILMFIEHEYHLRVNEKDIPNKNNFFSLSRGIY